MEEDMTEAIEPLIITSKRKDGTEVRMDVGLMLSRDPIFRAATAAAFQELLDGGFPIYNVIQAGILLKDQDGLDTITILKIHEDDLNVELYILDHEYGDGAP
jgi:hypothetical protein